MPTTITKTIGTGGDYANPQAWYDDMVSVNTSPQAADQVWVGKLKNQEFTNGSSTNLTIGAVACTATQYIQLQCDTGAAWNDSGSVRTNPWYYNSTDGGGRIKLGSGSFQIPAISVACDYFQLINVQVWGSDSFQLLGNAIKITGNHALLKDCILIGDDTPIDAASGASFDVFNCLVIQARGREGGAAIKMTAGTVRLIGDTLLNLVGPHGYCINPFGTTVTIKDCAIFNFNTLLDPGAGGGYTLTATYNGTDFSSLTGTGNVTSLTYASQFVSTSPTYDFRAATGGGLKIGNPDSNILLDASGFTRGGSTIWAGGWEATAAGAIPGTVTINSFLTTQVVIKITGTTGATGTIHNQLKRSDDGGSTFNNVGTDHTGATVTFPADTGLTHGATPIWEVAVTDDVATSTSGTVSMTMPYSMVLCVGDSITAGHIGGVNTTSYAEYLQTLLGNTFGVVNLGSGGATLETLAGIDYSGYHDGNAIYNVMILQGGFNDFNSEGDNAAAIEADLAAWCSAHSNWIIARLGLMPAVESVYPGYGAVQSAVVAAEKTNWQSWGYKGLIDVPELTTMSDPSNTTYYQSTPHTTDAGNQQMANAAAPIVLEMINTTVSGSAGGADCLISLTPGVTVCG